MHQGTMVSMSVVLNITYKMYKYIYLINKTLIYMQHYLQQPRHGRKPSAHQQKISLRRCGTYIYIYIYISVYRYRYGYRYNGILLNSLKKNEILQFAATWMDRENTMLSEI